MTKKISFLIILFSLLQQLTLAQDTTNNVKDIGVTNPDNVKEEVTYDGENKQYVVLKKVGDIVIGTEYIPEDQYRDRQLNKSTGDYWRDKDKSRTQGKESNSLIPAINLGEGFGNIFGSNKVEIKPQGSAEIILGVRVNKNDNPNIPLQQRTITTFQFDQKIQVNLIAKIGDKINFNTNFNTEALFNFENQLKLKYEGKEDDILQLLEAGNVSLPLTGTLIQGSTALFGIKNKLKFGKLEITTVYSQQQGQKQNITVEGGAQVTKFELVGSNYEANRHYFLGDYFMNQFDRANENLPFVTSPTNITRIEVWITNRVNATENVRNIVAIMPLGENLPNGSLFPDNPNNQFNPTTLPPGVRDITSQTLFNVLDNGTEIEKVTNARLLNQNEYTFDPILGYISLNQSLNADEVLAVAYQYTAGGQTYQVGEFSTDISSPSALVVKLLKSTTLDVRQPTWNWMMKNIYSIGGFNIGSEDFILNILYQDTETGVKVNYFPNAPGLSGTPLLQVFNLDRLNQQNDRISDGFFDFIDGKTIRIQNGKIIFPSRQPFSTQNLIKKFQEANINNPGLDFEALAERYAFDSLYTTIQQLAELNTEKNRYYLGGSYKGASGSEISLNAFNVPQGSVTVTAGGQTLVENVDYTVDYTGGRVRIINDGLLSSGIPINISLENSNTFNIQTKRLIGTHLDYKFSKNFQIGATVMNLSERPLTQKIDIGNEPVNNTIWGFDVNYSTQAPFITRLVDKIPGIDTKAPSNVTFNGEFAHIIPGFNGLIDRNGDNGVSYIDDFEGAETPIDIRNPFLWKLGTVPENNPRFPNGNFFNDLRYNFNRARMTWFTMDPLFFRQNSLTPDHIQSNGLMRSNNYLREVRPVEVFPGFQPPIGQVQANQLVFDIHYYPTERGPYNFDVDGLDETITDKVRLKNPRDNFGSMMRRMETTDWDAANVSYIEFWMMDPLMDTDLNQLKEFDLGPGNINQNTLPDGGGDLIIQIGNMNEDVLRDGRMAFENGMPTPTEPNRPLITTNWGKVPALQPINQNFDNDPATRLLQDIGYDGLSDTAEQNFFQNYLNAVTTKYGAGAALDSILADPSNDNFRHYIGGSYNDNIDVPGINAIHNRYKYYLSPERNSPAGNSTESFGQLPNTEDVNSNFTLDQAEGYYQYAISLRKEDLDEIGKNYVTDILQGAPVTIDGNTKTARWIQFRVPVRGDEKEAFGNINNFRSIRFMRMVLQGFPDDIFVRMATLQLVRADWRTYEGLIADQSATWQTDAQFNVTTVNVEENTQKKPFPYTLPPGITREIDPANPQLLQLNEQSLVLNVCDLKDGEGKGVFKNTEYDLRAYRNLKMYVHAEEVLGNPIDSNDLTIFVRLGMDASENYYEYELPLKLSDPNIQPTSPDDLTYKRNVWPLSNEVNINLELLPEIKVERNKAGIPANEIYSDTIDGKRITVVGNPNIANVRTIMIGVRNPHSKNNPWQDGKNGAKKDDALPKCAQIWVNELRLTDYFESGGWAAKARTTIGLADLGEVGMSVSHTRFGFGNIDQKPQQRSRDNITTFDITTKLELGKFFGQKAGVNIPVFFGYSSSVANPQFNPLDPDVRLNAALDALSNPFAQDSLRGIVQKVQTRRTFNVTNMRKTRTNTTKAPKIWDISNFDASYSYADDLYRDIKTEYNNSYEHRASLGYSFSPTVKYWEPFKKSKKLKSKWAKFIKDFNFTYMPKRMGFRFNIQRDVNEFLLRNTTQYDLLILPTFRKNFTWVRTYEFQYNPFKSLAFTFNATNNSRIDEPEMLLDTTVRAPVQWLGRNTNYTHNFDFNYTVPFSKFPITDWISASVGYGGNFKWTASTMERNQLTGEFTRGRWGNVVQNANTIKVNGQITMTTLYNKIPWIKDLNKPKKNPPPKQNPNPDDTTKTKNKIKIVKWEKGDVNFRAGKKKTIKHDLKTENVKVKVFAPDGREIKGGFEVIDKKKIKFTASEDVSKATIKIEGIIEKKPFRWMVIPEVLARLATGLKNISGTYNESNGTILPGYSASTTILGMDFNNPSIGPDFVFGRQFSDIDLKNKIVQNNWLIRDSTLNVLFMRTHTSNLSFNGTYEPFKGFRVTLTANRTFAENYQSNYRFVPSAGDFAAQNPLTMGNFSMSTMTIGTAFGSGGPNFTSRLFNDMLNFRSTISRELASRNPNAAPVDPLAPYQPGYGATQQDVLLYSFLAAYTGGDPTSQSFDMFPDIPIPNWRVQFDGLKDIPIFKKLMKTIVLSHGYQSTYNVAGYQTNNAYNNQDPTIFKENPLAYSLKDDNGNYISQYFLNSVTIVESFNPLIKVDMTFQNSLTAAVEVKSSRNISLSFPNSQVTENNVFEVTIGAGYMFKEVRLPFLVNGRPIKNSLNVRLDIGIRENSTIIRKIKEELEQVTAGQQAITIKTFAEYTVNTSLSVRLFFDHVINNPFVANQFPTANTNAGLSVRFTLAP